MSKRVVILIDANEGEILECPEEIEVKFILWERITDEHYADPNLIDELDTAIETDLDKAITMSEALTTKPPDDGYDEDPRVVGYPS